MERSKSTLRDPIFVIFIKEIDSIIQKMIQTFRVVHTLIQHHVCHMLSPLLRRQKASILMAQKNRSHLDAPGL